MPLASWPTSKGASRSGGPPRTSRPTLREMRRPPSGAPAIATGHRRRAHTAAGGRAQSRNPTGGRAPHRVCNAGSSPAGSDHAPIRLTRSGALGYAHLALCAAAGPGRPVAAVASVDLAFPLGLQACQAWCHQPGPACLRNRPPGDPPCRDRQLGLQACQAWYHQPGPARPGTALQATPPATTASG